MKMLVLCQSDNRGFPTEAHIFSASYISSSKPMQVGSEATTWCSTLAQVCARLSADIIAVRRHLHAHPELSLQEFATTAYLAERVEALGSMVDVTQQRIGLTCDWQSRQTEASHRRIGLRGDIDALPIETSS